MSIIPQASFSYSKKAILSDIGSLARFSLASPAHAFSVFRMGSYGLLMQQSKGGQDRGGRKEVCENGTLFCVSWNGDKFCHLRDVGGDHLMFPTADKDVG